MYGLVIQVKMDMAREAEARKLLKDVVVPQAKARAGFEKGYWMRAVEGNLFRSVQLYDTAESARAAAEKIKAEGPPPGAPAKLESVDVYEVVEQA